MEDAQAGRDRDWMTDLIVSMRNFFGLMKRLRGRKLIMGLQAPGSFFGVRKKVEVKPPPQDLVGTGRIARF